MDDYGSERSRSPISPMEFPQEYRPSEKTIQLWKVNSTRAKRDGKRKTIYEKTGQYKGEWLNDLKHGEGIFTWKNGNMYEGGWCEGKPGGLGAFWVNKKNRLRIVYKGEWKNGLKEGYGTQWFQNGDLYEGFWSGGLCHGDQGVMRYANGDVYDGEWKNGKRHGFGVLVLANDDQYEGFWANDLKHGQGTYYYVAKNRKYEAEWENDIAKVGTFSELEAPPQSPRKERQNHGRLPKSFLLNKEQVIKEQVELIRERNRGNEPDVSFLDYFSQQQIEAFEKAFVAADREGQGYITSVELVMLLGAVGEHPDETDIDHILESMGKEIDSEISFPEFAQIMVLYRELKDQLEGEEWGEEDGEYGDGGEGYAYEEGDYDNEAREDFGYDEYEQ